jgi:hypothetical protein
MASRKAKRSFFRKKYGYNQPDPLEEEENLAEMKPNKEDVRRQKIQYFRNELRKISQKAGPKTIFDKKRIGALEFQLAIIENGGLSSRIRQKFVEDFNQWTLGNHKKWNHPTLTPWGYRSLARLPGVAEYHKERVYKRVHYLNKLAELYMEGPHDINSAYIFYKYIVRRCYPRNEQDFLREMDQFFPDDYLLIDDSETYKKHIGDTFGKDAAGAPCVQKGDLSKTMARESAGVQNKAPRIVTGVTKGQFVPLGGKGASMAESAIHGTEVSKEYLYDPGKDLDYEYKYNFGTLLDPIYTKDDDGDDGIGGGDEGDDGGDLKMFDGFTVDDFKTFLMGRVVMQNFTSEDSEDVIDEVNNIVTEIKELNTTDMVIINNLLERIANARNTDDDDGDGGGGGDGEDDDDGGDGGGGYSDVSDDDGGDGGGGGGDEGDDDDDGGDGGSGGGDEGDDGGDLTEKLNEIKLLLRINLAGYKFYESTDTKYKNIAQDITAEIEALNTTGKEEAELLVARMNSAQTMYDEEIKARETEEREKKEEEERRKKEAEERKMIEAEAARLAKEAEEARLAKEEEERKRKEAEAARLAKEEEERKRKEAEAARLAKEEEERKRKEAEAARLAKEEEERKRKEAEAARLAKEEEERKKREEAERLAKEEEERKKKEEAYLGISFKPMFVEGRTENSEKLEAMEKEGEARESAMDSLKNVIAGSKNEDLKKRAKALLNKAYTLPVDDFESRADALVEEMILAKEAEERKRKEAEAARLAKEEEERKKKEEEEKRVNAIFLKNQKMIEERKRKEAEAARLAKEEAERKRKEEEEVQRVMEEALRNAANDIKEKQEQERKRKEAEAARLAKEEAERKKKEEEEKMSETERRNKTDEINKKFTAILKTYKNDKKEMIKQIDDILKEADWLPQKRVKYYTGVRDRKQAELDKEERDAKFIVKGGDVPRSELNKALDRHIGRFGKVSEKQREELMRGGREYAGESVDKPPTRAELEELHRLEAEEKKEESMITNENVSTGGKVQRAFVKEKLSDIPKQTSKPVKEDDRSLVEKINMLAQLRGNIPSSRGVNFISNTENAKNRAENIYDMTTSMSAAELNKARMLYEVMNDELNVPRTPTLSQRVNKTLSKLAEIQTKYKTQNTKYATFIMNIKEAGSLYGATPEIAGQLSHLLEEVKKYSNTHARTMNILETIKEMILLPSAIAYIKSKRPK